MARPSITMYYDLVSPYSYIGYVLLQRYRRQWPGVDIIYKPIFLGGLMLSAKNQPPANIPAKGAHMMRDLKRISKISDIPYGFPSDFPLMTVPASRFLLAVQKGESSSVYEECITKLYHAHWADDKKVTDKDILIATCAPVFGGSTSKVEQYLAQTVSDPTIKQQLIANTEEIAQLGGFGAPMLVVKHADTSRKDEVIFGSDRFEMIANLLNVPYPGMKFDGKGKL